MHHAVRISSIVSAAVLCGCGALPGAAAAATGASAPATMRGDVAAPPTSQYFAGYTAPLTAKKSVEATITVPTLQCGAETQGVDTDVELSANHGAIYSDGAIISHCLGGTPEHQVRFESSIDGQVAIEQPVLDGDKIHISQVFKRGKIVVTMTNMTQDWSVKHTFTGITPDEAAVQYYRIIVGGQDAPPLDTGATVKGARVGGAPLETTHPVKTTLVDAQGKPLVEPSAIKKTNFKFVYVG